MKRTDKIDWGRVKELYAAYGADPRRWPAQERWRHTTATLPPEIAREAAEAQLVDRLLAMAPDPKISVPDHRLILERAVASPTVSIAPAVPVRDKPVSRRGVVREWPAALALAASLALGMWLGAAGVADDLLPNMAAGQDNDAVALDLPDNLDFDAGEGT